MHHLISTPCIRCTARLRLRSHGAHAPVRRCMGVARIYAGLCARDLSISRYIFRARGGIFFARTRVSPAESEPAHGRRVSLASDGASSGAGVYLRFRRAPACGMRGARSFIFPSRGKSAGQKRANSRAFNGAIGQNSPARLIPEEFRAFGASALARLANAESACSMLRVRTFRRSKRPRPIADDQQRRDCRNAPGREISRSMTP